jgi:hypothetical protein
VMDIVDLYYYLTTCGYDPVWCEFVQLRKKCRAPFFRSDY